jgi:hypothetical protein
MTPEEAVGRLLYRGPPVLRPLLGEVLARLPPDVWHWLSEETGHAFLSSDLPGEFIPVEAPAREVADTSAGLYRLRVIYLSAHLLALPHAEALWIIARDVARSRLGHFAGRGGKAEEEADRLAAEWGFQAPPGRPGAPGRGMP